MGEVGGRRGGGGGNKEKREIEGEQKWPPFPFPESNQIPLIAHYLKRLSGAVMRLHGGPRLRDFLVYRCWRVLRLTGWASAGRGGKGRREGGEGEERGAAGTNT